MNSTAYPPKVTSVLKLADVSYEQYNTNLPLIKAAIKKYDMVGHKRVETFERVLKEELPFQTARRAYRIAILVALGQEIQREQHEETRRSVKQTENGKATPARV